MPRLTLIPLINHCEDQHWDTDTHCTDVNLLTNKTDREALHLNNGLGRPLNVSALLICIFYEGTTKTVQNLLIFIFLLILVTYIFIENIDTNNNKNIEIHIS